MAKGKPIDINDAAAMTKKYRGNHPGQPISTAYDRDLVEKILDQDGCVGLRMYYAQNADDALCLVLVGTDKNGDDLYKGELMEWGAPCPPDCPSPNPLMK